MDNIKRKGDGEKENKLKILEEELERKMKTVNDESDIAEIRKIMARMEELDPLEITSTSEERLNDFKNDYLPIAIKDKKEFEAIQNGQENKIHKKQAFYSKRIFKISFASVALLILINFTTIAYAGVNIYELFISWTDGTFTRSSQNQELNPKSQELNPTIDPDKVYNNYQSISDDFEVPIFKPNYLIENYDIELFDQHVTASQTDFYITYKKGKEVITYDITIYDSNQSSYEYNLEKNSDYFEIYKDNGIDYYIMSNNNWYSVTWDYFNTFYTSSGYKSIDDVMKFIDSLEK